MEAQPRELTLGPEPHLVVIRGASYCYTCDEEIETPRLDGQCPRQVKSKDNAARRVREKEARQWRTR